ncbi:MAG: glycosyltransferase family 61 protein [Algoriphagus sp.]|nr:glycosyltransferase family 61 protein [Algoriphagus sp.]
MVQEITAHRTLPENLRPEDLWMFSPALKATFYTLLPITLKNVAVLQDTIFHLKERKFYAHYTHVNSLGFLPLAKRVTHCALKSWRTIDDGIWIKDEWSANYFHWMTDCLPRLWLGLQEGKSNKVILMESFKHLSYVTQSLELLGIEPVYFKSGENLLVKNLVLTGRTANFANFNEPLTRLTREKLAIKSVGSQFRKVYVSRKLAPKRKTHNELEVELLVRKKGYEIVYMEKMTLKEQINLMAETKILVSLHGAALTNMTFMQEGLTVVELRNQNDDKSNCYFNLASTLGIKYFYTLNKGDHKNTILTDFTVDLIALEKVLDELN